MPVELATAYVSLVPSAKGIGASVARELGGLDKVAKEQGERTSRSFGDAFKNGAKYATAGLAIIGGAAVAAGVKSVTAFAGFDRQMREVFTLLPGITQTAMDDMTARTKSFATEFGVLPEKVVPALYQSLSAGVPKENVFEFLETAQKAAKGGVTELETAVDGLSSVVNAYGSDTLNATQASDLMFTTVRLGKTNLQQLSESLFQVVPTASALGVKFGDVSAALATMTLQGVPTAVATTQLRQAFVELSKDGTKTSALFKELSGKTFKEFVAAGGDSQEALQLLADHAEKTGVGVNDLFGSVEAGSAALALTGSNAENFASNIDQMNASAGATETAFGTMNSGIGATFERIRAKASVAMIEVGAWLGPRIESAIAIGQRALGAVQAWWAANGPGIRAAAERVFGAIGDWVRDVAPAIRSWVQDVLAELSDWWSTWGPRITAVVESIASAIATLVRGAVRGAQFIVRNWGTIRPILVALGAVITTVLIPHWIRLGVQSTLASAKNAAGWIAGKREAITSGASQVAQSYRIVGGWIAQGAAAVAQSARAVGAWVAQKAAAIASAAATVAQVARQVAAWVLLGVQSTLHAAKVAAAWLISMGPIALVVAAVVALVVAIVKNWDKIKAAIAAGWAAIKAGVQAAWQWITDRIKQAVGFLVTLFLNFTGPGLIIKHWDTIKNATKAAWQFVTDKVSGFVSFFTGVPGKVASAASGMWDGIKDAFRSAANWIIRAWNGLEFKIPGFDPPGPGPKFGGFTLGVPKIPTLHSGGLVPGGPRDESLWRLRGGELVITPEQQAAGVGAGGVVFNFPNVRSGAEAETIRGTLSDPAMLAELSRALRVGRRG